IPGVGAYFVLPPLRAAMHASLMCSGVSKSGSPAAKPQTSSPAACRALAFASTARVGEGETLRAQDESGAGGLLMDKRCRRKGPVSVNASPANSAEGTNKKRRSIDRRAPDRVGASANYFLRLAGFEGFTGRLSSARRNNSPTLAS